MMRPCGRRAHPGASAWLWLLLVLLGLPAGGAAAEAAAGQPPAAPERPRAVVVLLPGTPAEAFFQELAAPRWESLRRESTPVLVNPAVPGLDTAISAYVTLGAGRRMEAPSEMPAAYLLGDARAGGRRPFLPGFPAYRGELILLRPWLRLDGSEESPGTLGEYCARARVTVAYLGRPAPEWPNTLEGRGYTVAMDTEGDVPLVTMPLPGEGAGPWLPPARALLEQAGLVVVDLPPGTPIPVALELSRRLSEHLDPRRDTLLLTSPDPGRPWGWWYHLAPALFWGSQVGGGTLSSATTRTPGLLANVDLVPTLLDRLEVSAPPYLEGHPARTSPGSMEDLLGLARQSRVNRALMVPALLAWGGLALLSVLLATAVLLRRGGAGWIRAARAGLALTGAFVVAMLLAAWTPPSGSTELALRLAVLTVLVGGGAVLAARGGSPFMLLVLGGTVLILGDLYGGDRMLSRNLMSDFANIGARFYGIGNEYLGILLSISVLAPFWIERRRGNKGRFGAAGWGTAAVLWPVTLVGVGSPAIGADFGGAVSLAVTYLIAGCLAARFRPRVTHLVSALAFVALMGLGFIASDLLRPAGARSHVGELASRALEPGGVGEIARVVGRKLWLNVTMALTPYFLGGVGVMLPVVWLWRRALGSRVTGLLEDEPLLAAGMGAVLAGAVIAGVLNDTGVIAWAMATCCVLLLGLDQLLARQAETRQPGG